MQSASTLDELANNTTNDNSKVWLDEQLRFANECRWHARRASSSYNDSDMCMYVCIDDDGSQYHGFLLKTGGTLGGAPHRRWFHLDGDEAAVPSRELTWGNFSRDKTNVRRRAQ
jgi:hypothetical protein